MTNDIDSQTRQQISQAAHFLANLVMGAGVTVLAQDLHGRVTLFNRAAEAFYGYTNDAVVGSQITMLVHPSCRQDHDRAVYTAAREGHFVELQTEHIASGGRALGVRVMFSPVHDDLGAVVGVSLFVIDVTDSLTIQTALQQERDVLEAVLETTTDAMVMIDPDGRVLTMNAQFEAFFNVPRYQHLGYPVDALLDAVRQRDDLPPDFSNIFSTLGKDMQRTAGGDFEIPSPNRRVLIWYSIPVHAHDGALMGRLYAFHDATRERDLDRMKTEFLSLVSHELRTPLTSIVGFNEMVLDGDAGEINEEVQEFLEIIKLNAVRLRVLIDDILDLTKLEAGHVDIHPESYALPTIVEVVVQSLRPMIEDKKHTLSLEIANDLPAIWADRDRLVQVLTNLVANACKYTDPHGALAIHARISEDEAALPGEPPRGIALPAFVISVHDNGMGINLKDQERIFDSFYRTEEVSRRQIQGSGLGLTIVRRFVELHGGRIWVQSEQGTGSSFHFTIPVVKGI